MSDDTGITGITMNHMGSLGVPGFQGSLDPWVVVVVGQPQTFLQPEKKF